MNLIRKFAESILHGDADHQKWLLDAATKFEAEHAEEISGVHRDAERYRFMRDEENWGEDSGDDSWENLAQSSFDAFDEIVDSRMAKDS